MFSGSFHFLAEESDRLRDFNIGTFHGSDIGV